MPWLYQNTEFTDPQDYFGMVYLITNIQTGKQYIGRKYFTKSKVLQKTQTRKRRKKLRVESDWESYYGSSADLLEDIALLGKDQFKREILHLCKKRGETNYLETKEIIERGALLSDRFYNKWLFLKLHKATLVSLHLLPSSISNQKVLDCEELRKENQLKSVIGIPKSDEHKTKMSKARSKWWTPERRAAMSLRQLGVKHSPERIAKMRTSLIGIRKGVPISANQRLAITEFNKRRKGTHYNKN